MELNQISAFSASYSRINPCFTAGKRMGVWNCQATSGHQKTTIFTPIAYDISSLSSETSIASILFIYYSFQDAVSNSSQQNDASKYFLWGKGVAPSSFVASGKQWTVLILCDHLDEERKWSCYHIYVSTTVISRQLVSYSFYRIHLPARSLGFKRGTKDTFSAQDGSALDQTNNTSTRTNEHWGDERRLPSISRLDVSSTIKTRRVVTRHASSTNQEVHLPRRREKSDTKKKKRISFYWVKSTDADELPRI